MKHIEVFQSLSCLLAQTLMGEFYNALVKKLYIDISATTYSISIGWLGPSLSPRQTGLDQNRFTHPLTTTQPPNKIIYQLKRRWEVKSDYIILV